MKIKTKNISEDSFDAKFWTALGWSLRNILPTLILAALAVWMWQLATASSVEAHYPHEREISDYALSQMEPNPTHYSLEYYVEGTRYVRTMNYEMARLVEGTARDFGINPTHLLALCIQEGSVPANGHYFACDPTAVGDHGMARGMFQIHTGIHDVSTRDAEHPYFSAVWTADRMNRYGYQKNPKRAMMCHNGCNSTRYGDTVWAIARTIKVIDPLLYLE